MVAPGTLATLLGGAAAVAVALWLILLNPGHRATRIYAALLFCLGFVQAAPAVAVIWGDADDFSLAYVMNGYVLIPVPILAAYLATLFPRRRTWLGRSRWGGVAIFGVILSLELLYLRDHSVFLPTFPAAPLYLLRMLELPVFGFVGLLFVRDYVRAGHEPRANAILAVALGFCLAAGYLGSRDATAVINGFPALAARRTAWALAWLPAAAAGLLLARAALATRPSTLARTRWASAIGVGVACVAGPLVFVTRTTLPGGDVLRNIPLGLATLAIPILATWGILRYHLFDVHVRLRRSVRVGALLAMFLAAAYLANLAARRLLAPDAALLVELAVLALLVVALLRLQGLADRVANLLVPPPKPLEAQRVEVYRSALEQVVGEGATPTPRESAVLESLRRELGLSDRDHALLEYAVRAGRPGAARDSGPGPGETLLGKYRLEHELGHGAHGRTFLAKDIVLGRPVALKVIRPEAADGEAVLREARALAGLHHPNVVAIYDAERVGDATIIVMEYAAGGSLRTRLDTGRLDADGFQGLATDLLAALAAVHATGVIHRDVKPSNVLFGADGRARLGDFGIAHAAGSETTIGRLVDGAAWPGTLRYMSPEQAKGHAMDERSDLWSAAATMYEAWTGRPYRDVRAGESAFDLQFRAAAQGPFTAPLDAPPALRAWFARALDPRPGRRFASSNAMAAALQAALGPTTRPRTKGGTGPRQRRRLDAASPRRRAGAAAS